MYTTSFWLLFLYHCITQRAFELDNAVVKKVLQIVFEVITEMGIKRSINISTFNYQNETLRNKRTTLYKTLKSIHVLQLEQAGATLEKFVEKYLVFLND